jgi:hypothetical protein
VTGRRWTEWAVAGVGVLGLALARFGPGTQAGRFAAVLGVGLAVGSSVVALLLKRWGFARSLQATLAAVGAVFMLRLVLVVVGLLVTKAHGGAWAAYVVGFFAPYLVLQWVEIIDVLAENRRGRGEG